MVFRNPVNSPVEVGGWNPSIYKALSGWWFQRFVIFIPIWGNDDIWRAYFSKRLVQPPTSKVLCIQTVVFSRDFFQPSTVLSSFKARDPTDPVPTRDFPWDGVFWFLVFTSESWGIILFPLEGEDYTWYLLAVYTANWVIICYHFLQPEKSVAWFMGWVLSFLTWEDPWDEQYI